MKRTTIDAERNDTRMHRNKGNTHKRKKGSN